MPTRNRLRVSLGPKRCYIPTRWIPNSHVGRERLKQWARAFSVNPQVDLGIQVIQDTPSGPLSVQEFLSWAKNPSRKRPRLDRQHEKSKRSRVKSSSGRTLDTDGSVEHVSNTATLFSSGPDSSSSSTTTTPTAAAAAAAATTTATTGNNKKGTADRHSATTSYDHQGDISTSLSSPPCNSCTIMQFSVDLHTKLLTINDAQMSILLGNPNTLEDIVDDVDFLDSIHSGNRWDGRRDISINGQKTSCMLSVQRSGDILQFYACPDDGAAAFFEFLLDTGHTTDFKPIQMHELEWFYNWQKMWYGLFKQFTPIPRDHFLIKQITDRARQQHFSPLQQFDDGSWNYASCKFVSVLDIMQPTLLATSLMFLDDGIFGGNPFPEIEVSISNHLKAFLRGELPRYRARTATTGKLKGAVVWIEENTISWDKRAYQLGFRICVVTARLRPVNTLSLADVIPSFNGSSM